MDETTQAAMESGRPLTIFNIREVHQLNPNATHVTNHYYGDQFVPKEHVHTAITSPHNKTQPATRNPQLIIDYVMRLHPIHVRQEWREKYQALWNDVLELPAVADRIYDKGKQQHEYEFNRDLVGKILRLLKTEGVMTHQANATKMSEELEGNKNSSVRTHLGLMPPDDVKTAVKALISQKGKES